MMTRNKAQMQKIKLVMSLDKFEKQKRTGVKEGTIMFECHLKQQHEPV